MNNADDQFKSFSEYETEKPNKFNFLRFEISQNPLLLLTSGKIFDESFTPV